MTYPYLNADEMIKETLIFNEGQPLSADAPFHIAYGIDKNFLFGCGVSIASVLLHNRSMNFVFHVFYLMSIFLAKKNSTLRNWHRITAPVFRFISSTASELTAFPTTKNWSVAM